MSLVKRAVHVYKKAYYYPGHGGPRRAVVVTLLLPKGTRTNYPVKDRAGKNRANQAKVLRIRLVRDARKSVRIAYSDWNSNFAYRPGELVKPQYTFSSHYHGDCASGIHFFRDRERAKRYGS